MLPPERRDGLLVMCHEHATHVPVELLEIGETVVDAILSCNPRQKPSMGMQVVAASGWQTLQPQARLPVGQRRRACVLGGYHGDRRSSPPLSRWGPPRLSLEGYTAETSRQHIAGRSDGH